MSSNMAELPLNPFRVFEYFLGDRVDRELVRQANNNLISRSDELWVFGDHIADGVFFEIRYAQESRKAAPILHRRTTSSRRSTRSPLRN